MVNRKNVDTQERGLFFRSARCRTRLLFLFKKIRRLFVELVIGEFIDRVHGRVPLARRVILCADFAPEEKSLQAFSFFIGGRDFERGRVEAILSEIFRLIVRESIRPEAAQQREIIGDRSLSGPPPFWLSCSLFLFLPFGQDQGILRSADFQPGYLIPAGREDLFVSQGREILFELY